MWTQKEPWTWMQGEVLEAMNKWIKNFQRPWVPPRNKSNRDGWIWKCKPMVGHMALISFVMLSDNIIKCEHTSDLISQINDLKWHFVKYIFSDQYSESEEGWTRQQYKVMQLGGLFLSLKSYAKILIWFPHHLSRKQIVNISILGIRYISMLTQTSSQWV